jgi:hypothetical protein
MGERRGVFYLLSNYFYLPSRRWEEGGNGVGILWVEYAGLDLFDGQWAVGPVPVLCINSAEVADFVKTNQASCTPLEIKMYVWLPLQAWTRPLESQQPFLQSRSYLLNGTQDWEFFWHRFWNLRYFFVIYG